MVTTSLNLLHLPFSTSAPSFPSRQFPHHLPLKTQPNNSTSLVCKAKECYNVEVVIDEDEPSELGVRYFEREVSQAGIFQEWRRRKFHENAKDKRIRKSQDRARLRRRRSGGQRSGGNTGSSGGSSSSSRSSRRERDDYDEEEDETNDALERLLDSDYQEGNLEVLEMDLPDEVWEADGNGETPIDF